MADKNNNLPKVPPPNIPRASNHQAEELDSLITRVGKISKPTTKNTDFNLTQGGALRLMILFGSFISFGIAMIGAAWVTVQVFDKGLENQIGILPKILAIGLAYVIGWIVSIYGVRRLGHLTLPILIKAFALITLAGICILQIAIVLKLYNQSYDNTKFVVFLTMMGIGLFALIGFHLIVENHNLVPFAFPILIVSLFHLIVIVSHYVFTELSEDKYAYFWSDALFFLFTTIIGVLILSHSGILNGVRGFVNRMFRKKDN